MKALLKGSRQFQLRVVSYGNSYYIERTVQLERLLARKPREVQIELVGVGEIPADSALLIRSVLLARSPKTRIITNARSSLQGGSVLVWLMGDCRIIRDDARIFFRRVELPADNQPDAPETWSEAEPKFSDSFDEIDPEDGDYVRVLELINEFLPVKEMAGRVIGVPALRQFGLVENEKIDGFLSTVFRKESQPEDERKIRKTPSRKRSVSI